MNSSFPPLYPQEAYPEQNSQVQNYQNACAGFCQGAQNNPTQQNSCGIGNLILPLLLKSMGGKLPVDLLKSLGGSSPLLSALSSLSEQKKSPAQSVGEKDFPDC